MKHMNETDLRAMLRAEADRFQRDQAWLADLGKTRRAKSRRNLASIVALAALVITSLLYTVSMEESPLTPEAQAHPIYIRLAGYQADKGASMPADLRLHLNCMRDHGFDLPDPSRTGGGWVLKINDPESLGLETNRWKHAAFGTCALVRDRATYNRWIHRAIMDPRPRHRQ
jgi:hypothetical protein